LPRPRERQNTVFMCQECGHESPRWMGFCPAPGCRSPLPLKEVSEPAARNGARAWLEPAGAPVQELASLSLQDQRRVELASGEVNRVLGGGLVPGSVVLLAGEPGVGKSTLLLQIAQWISSRGQKVLYVSGEESPHQIKLRSDRLGFGGQGVFLLAETDVDQLLQQMEEQQPALAIVDSIQTLYTSEVPSGPGSVVQVRECGLRLMRWAKGRNVPVLIAGHVTKDGALAGPRVLEHMVDVVMYLEGEDLNTYRILRNGKNRFGSTTEIGVFEMGSRGLAEVDDPSRVLLAQRHEDAVGAALAPVMEGTRPLLLEVQALTAPTQLPAPRRVANGVDYNRLLMLAAVASRRAGLDLGGQDIIVSVAGGFRVSEPAADLAVVLALASSLYNRPLGPGLAALGEVGLTGELRSVPQMERRLAECSRLGLTRCVLPQQAAGRKLDQPPALALSFARTLRQAVREALGPPQRGRNAWQAGAEDEDDLGGQN